MFLWLNQKTPIRIDFRCGRFIGLQPRGRRSRYLVARGLCPFSATAFSRFFATCWSPSAQATCPCNCAVITLASEQSTPPLLFIVVFPCQMRSVSDPIFTFRSSSVRLLVLNCTESPAMLNPRAGSLSAPASLKTRVFKSSTGGLHVDLQAG